MSRWHRSLLPSPPVRSTLEIKLADTKIAVDGGADEIDMVIDRGAFLAGRYGTVFEQIVAIKGACGAARLKVILETGELATYDNVRRPPGLRFSRAATSSKPRPARSPQPPPCLWSM